MYPTFHTNETLGASRTTSLKHQFEMRSVLEQLMEHLDRKGEDYNQLHSFSENVVFGDYSWVTYIFNKAHRLASVVSSGRATFDSIEEILMDLITYTLAYLAWRRMKNKEEAPE